MPARGPGSALLARLVGQTARAGSWALMGQLATAVASTASFVLLARIFGPATYGLIAGSLALVLTVGLFSSFGASALVVRDIAGGRLPPAAALSAALLVVVVGATTAGCALVALRPLLLPQVPLGVLMTLVVAELLANAMSACCVGSFFAVERARAAGSTVAAVGAAKVAAVAAVGTIGDRDPQTWALYYALAATIVATAAVLIAFRRYGGPVLRGHRPLSRAREGFPFSFNYAANATQNDADKILLVRFGLAAEAGMYTAAYRIVSLALLPLQALLQVTYPKFFSLGHQGGVSATAAFSRRLLPPLLAYAAVSGVLLAACAPLLPWVLGPDYQGSVPLLLLLAPLVLLKVVHYMPAEALTGAGFQVTRAKCTAASAAVNVGLCLLLIPRYGVLAAVAATFVAEILLGVLVRLALRRRLAQPAAAHVSGSGPRSALEDKAQQPGAAPPNTSVVGELRPHHGSAMSTRSSQTSGETRRGGVEPPPETGKSDPCACP